MWPWKCSLVGATVPDACRGELKKSVGRRVIAIELKLCEFRAADKGQMELYLRWLENYEQEPGSAVPLGIILCSRKNREQIELLELFQSGIHVVEYLTGWSFRQLLE